jgi:hypothetical protein
VVDLARFGMLYRQAVRAAGRRKLIMAALWTEACLTFPALDAMREGYETYPAASEPWPEPRGEPARQRRGQPASPVDWLPRRESAVAGGQGGGEEVDEQLCDALGLVVMDPVRRVGQALDPDQVGYVVVVGLG